ncbi:hypothetical protein [Gilvimarinus sp. F26214L]
MATLILGGVAFIGLAMSSLDIGSERIIGELLAVFVLIGALMLAAFIAALGLRALQSRREKDENRDDEEED